MYDPNPWFGSFVPSIRYFRLVSRVEKLVTVV